MKPTKAFLRSMEYRAVSICVTAIVTFLVTQDIALAAIITGATDFTKTIVHAIWLKYRT